MTVDVLQVRAFGVHLLWHLLCNAAIYVVDTLCIIDGVNDVLGIMCSGVLNMLCILTTLQLLIHALEALLSLAFFPESIREFLVLCFETLLLIMQSCLVSRGSSANVQRTYRIVCHATT